MSIAHTLNLQCISLVLLHLLQICGYRDTDGELKCIWLAGSYASNPVFFLNFKLSCDMFGKWKETKGLTYSWVLRILSWQTGKEHHEEAKHLVPLLPVSKHVLKQHSEYCLGILHSLLERSLESTALDSRRDSINKEAQNMDRSEYNSCYPVRQCLVNKNISVISVKILIVVVPWGLSSGDTCLVCASVLVNSSQNTIRAPLWLPCNPSSVLTTLSF